MKQINDIVTHEFGKKEGLPVLFIHGFPFDNRMWMNQVRVLEKEYHIITYDVRGLGESPAGDGQFTMEGFVDDLFDVIAGLGIDRPVICGHSMGGYIALRAAERDQSKFRGLILVDTKAESDDNAGKLKRAAAIKRINEEGIKGYVTDFLPNCFSDVSVNEHPDVFPVVLERALHSTAAGLKGCLLAMAGRTDTSAFLGEIRLPVLIICGVLDAIVPAEQMHKMAEKIKDAEFAAAPRSGHVPAIENPEFVNDVISGFLKRRIKS